jgi:hypothetical protein
MDDFATHKLDLEKKITEEIINQYEKQAMSNQEMADLAQFILERYEKITNHEELVNFMNELENQSPFFKNLATIEKGEDAKSAEQDAAKQALELLQSGQAGQAAQVAGAANE